MVNTVVQIGNTLWDQHTGALTARGGTSVRQEQQADGSIKLHPQALPDESSGTITTTKLVASELQAQQLNILASALIDSRVGVALPGIVLSGLRVQGVEIRVEPKRYRAEQEWLVTAVWAFGPREDDDGDPRTLYVPQRVQTATRYGEWVDRTELVCTALAETAGDTPGSAAFLQVVDTLDAAAAPLDVAGHYVRVWLPTGTDLVRPTGYAVAWTGKLKTRSVGTDSNRVTVLFAAIDMTDEWDTYLTQWYERKSFGVVVDPGEMPAFNALPGGDRTTDGLGPGGTEIHDRVTTPGTPWRASHIVDILLAALRDQFEGGPTWVLSGQRTALDNFQACELDGRSLREQLRQLIGRGLGFRVDVDSINNDILLSVCSPLRTALTAGGWTIPASTAQQSIDLTALRDLSGWNLGEDWCRVMDYVLMEASRPWHAISLGIARDEDLQLVAGFTEGEETTWDAADENGRNGALAHVYRRFRLSTAWEGGSYKNPAAVLPLDRTLITDALHGVAGESGEWGAGGAFVPQAVRFSKVLPFTSGRDWTTPASATLSHQDPLERAFVCIVTDPGGAGERWTLLDMEVTVDDRAPVVTLGRDANDATTIKAALAAGKHLVITLGFLYPLPWRVSWHRDPAAWRIDRPRAVRYQRPDLEWRYMEADTVLGIVNGAPTLATAGNIGDKPATLDQLLGLARLSHEKPFYDLTYTRAGVLDLSTESQPGTLTTDATLPYGPAEGTVVALDAMIGVRAWNLDRTHPATTVSCSRRPVDVIVSPEQTAPPAVVAATLAAMAYRS